VSALTLRTHTTADPGLDENADAARAAAGDVDAFERLYRRHAGRIHALSRRMIGDAEADDVAQEVFVRAWRKLGKFRGESAFGTWLYRLAVNVILGRRATLGNYRQRFEPADPAMLPFAARRERVDLRVDFESAIQRLPRGARDVFVLHDVEGYTHEEIAELLEVTAGTSKSQLHRARMALRQYLG
jgi:RNA polymerase sigma-70 factor (ECF subfamily)